MFETAPDLASLFGLPVWLLIIVSVWSVVWKGFALWKSAKKNHAIWFIILLVVNTVGILEILYIFLFSEIKLDNTPKKKTNASRKKTRAKKK